MEFNESLCEGHLLQLSKYSWLGKVPVMLWIGLPTFFCPVFYQDKKLTEIQNVFYRSVLAKIGSLKCHLSAFRNYFIQHSTVCYHLLTSKPCDLFISMEHKWRRADVCGYFSGVVIV